MGEIEGVIVTPLRRICDDRGRVMHMMKSVDQGYNGFGEVYCSTANPGVVKGWHLHTKMTLNYVVIKGMIKFVLYDDRPDSPTKGNLMEFCIGEHNYVRVTVPINVWNGFMCTGVEEALVVDVTDFPHDSEEIRRQDPHNSSIPYEWKIKDR
tara:strand:- start:986 stop:1441 length:456 start_codon:yes stop_codon:yes gene_type:complete